MSTLGITTLVENTARGHGLLAEHGLALWIEVGTQRILFDAGQTGILRHNARQLGIDLASMDAIVLSHGHYDHTGGLADILVSESTTNNQQPTPNVQGKSPDLGVGRWTLDVGRSDSLKTVTSSQARLNGSTETPVFVHPAAFEDKYARNANGTSRAIGIPAASRSALADGAEIHPTVAPTEIGEGLWVTGPIPRQTDFEDTGGPFFKDAACLQPDDLIDDQAAFVETPDGLVVILGCAHAGIVNTLQYISGLLPGRTIDTVVGGTHLVTANATRIDKTRDALRAFDIRRLVPLHCTGFPAAAHLWNAFPDRVAVCPVGARVGFG